MIKESKTDNKDLNIEDYMPETALHMIATKFPTTL